MKSLIPGLAVRSVEQAIGFYEQALGFTHDFSLPGPDGSAIHGSVTRGDASIMFGTGPLPAGSVPGAGIVLYLNVADDEDIDVAFERAVAAGATVIEPPADQFWGDRNWTIADPDGYHLTIGKTTRQVSPEEMMHAVAAMAPAR